MTFNEHIDRLTEIEIVQKFMARNAMQAKLCTKGDDYSLIVFRLPYVVEFHDALIENYLDISIADLDLELMISGGSAVACSIEIGLQNRAELKTRNFDKNPDIDIFLSFQGRKMYDLHCDLEAIDKLFPLIEAKGLAAMRDGSFDPRFDFSALVSPMYLGLKEKYVRCIDRH